MRIRFILIVAVLVALAFGVGRLSAAVGTLDSPDVPASTQSFTLEDIYNRLNDGTAGVQSTFTEPAAGPGTGTMHDLNEIMDEAPAIDNTDGATETNVLDGKTFWGLTDGQWGPQTGNIATETVNNTTVSQLAGYYNAFDLSVVDTDLVSPNIRSGVSIYGVDGDPMVVDTSSGTATASDILSDTVAYVDGLEMTGTMTNNVAVTIVPTTTNQTIALGYHNGSGYVQGDADLVADNIKCGVTIFGVTGSIPQYVAKTGQTGCWDFGGGSISCTGTGQDGEYRNGGMPIVEPSGSSSFGNYKRTSFTCSGGFTDNGNGTVTDNLTGLIWLKNANCFGFRTWTQALSDANGLASGSYGLSDGSSAGDWRLPNINELRSLFDPGLSAPYLPAGHPFTGVQSSSYWASTTNADSTSGAWGVFLYYGRVFCGDKANRLYVWPVRGGQ